LAGLDGRAGYTPIGAHGDGGQDQPRLTACISGKSQP
jgi:hypothetical protein